MTIATLPGTGWSREEAELGLIGSVVTEPQKFVRVAHVEPEWMTTRLHRLLWGAMQRQVEETGELCFYEAVEAVIAEDDEIERGDMIDVLNRAHMTVYSGYYATDFAAYLRGEAARDRIQRASKAVSGAMTAQDAAASGRELADALASLNPRPDRGMSGGSVRDVMQKVINDFQQGFDQKRLLHDPIYDYVIGGVAPASMNIIAARPGRGKTTFTATALARCAAQGGRVGYITMEMPCEDIARIILSNLAGVTTDRLLTAKNATKLDFDRIFSGASRVDKFSDRMWIERPASRKVTDVAALARDMKERHGAEIIAIDHIGLMRSASKAAKRYDEVTSVSMDTKEMALNLGIPIIALCQVNRDAEKSGRKPIAADLRDSGHIEQDADTITFLCSNGTLEQDTWETIVYSVKNRHGRCMQIEVLFDRRVRRFIRK